MPISITDNGQGNVIDISPEIIERGRGTIILNGDNNTIKVAAPVFAFSPFFQLAGGASVEIGKQITAGNLFIYAIEGAKVSIGDRVGFNGLVRLLLHEAGSLTIGDDSLFGGDVDVTISDMHSIIDLDTQKRINPARNVVIGKRVWIGQRCIVLKGTEIGDGSVVGAGSVVTSRIPRNCIAAGNPARIVRVNVSWDPKL